MTEKQWETFFLLVDAIVNEKGKTWQEKAATLNAQADANSSKTNLAELAGWVNDD